MVRNESQNLLPEANNEEEKSKEMVNQDSPKAPDVPEDIIESANEIFNEGIV